MYRLPAGLLLAALLLTGCSPLQPVPVEKRTGIDIPISIWWQVEQEIVNASIMAIAPAADFASREITIWTDLIQRQSEAEFIPWYTDYWTQQWLLLKMAWYRLDQADGEESARKRMKSYLLEQFYQRVLLPVSKTSDPSQISEAATSLYLDALRTSAVLIQDRYTIPAEAWRSRLEQIRIIVIPTEPGLTVSLYQLLQHEDESGMPAYTELLKRIPSNEETLSPEFRGSDLDKVVDHTAGSLAEESALKGGVAAAALIAGGGFGLLISAGAALWDINEHAAGKSLLEAETRESIQSMLNEISHSLIDNREYGVLSPALHIHSSLEERLWERFQLLPDPKPPADYPDEHYPKLDTIF